MPFKQELNSFAQFRPPDFSCEWMRHFAEFNSANIVFLLCIPPPKELFIKMNSQANQEIPRDMICSF